MLKKAKLAEIGDSSGGKLAEARPFNQLWINSCYHQTLLPHAPWHKLEDEISKILAQKIEKQFSHPQRKEMLLEVLGDYFVEKYFPQVQRNPELLDVRHMSSDDRKHLQTDSENWLNIQMYKAVRQTGHGYLLTGIAPGEPTPKGAYADFLRDTFSVFTVGLDRELYLQEQKLQKMKAEESRHDKKSDQPDIYKAPAPSRLKQAYIRTSGISQTAGQPSVVQPKSSSLSRDPPPLWGAQSDLIGSAIVSLLQRDPRKFDVVVGRLHGRQLPGTLRSYIWADVLFKAERKKVKEVYVERILRERFALAVSRGLAELRIKKPTQSPINGLIQNAVIETYSKTVSMISYKHMEHMRETVRALNVLYVYDRSYEPYLVHWLFPLQLAFRNKEAMSDDKGEHVLELAMYLDLLNSSWFPTWPHVFAIAEQVMMKLQEQDVQLHDHLRHIAPINAQVNPKEFLVQLLHQEREEAEAILQTTSTNTPRAPTSATQFLTDPTIFLRRWIGEGFVSVLDTPGVMYVWDQLFMQSWQQSAIINVCLSLMELLRYKFLEAYDYNSMKEVFLMEACKLYTVDFQMAWIHVESGKDLLDISDLYNRQMPQSPVSALTEDVISEVEVPIDGLLKPCGIKNIRMSLTIPSVAAQKEPWLSNIRPEDLRLNVGVYFGSIKLRSRLSHSTSVITALSRDSYGSVDLDLEFPSERHIYDMLDLSQYDVERELGGNLYAIFNLERLKARSGRKSDVSPVTLGWARIPLYRQTGHHGDQSFALIEGDVTVPLHPGSVPESFISTQPQTPTEEDHVEGTLLGYNCTLSAHVFDPNNEPASRRVTPYKPEISMPPPKAQTNKVVKQPTPRNEPVKPEPKLRQQPVRPEPAPEPTHRPASPRHTAKDPDPWVLYKPAATKTDPKPTSNREPFVLYIDSAHYLPDCATIVKVTGRILRAGDLTNLQDILAVPDLNSSARSPVFNFSMLVNEGQQVADPELLLFLRVYTYDIEIQKVAVIGSALVRVFNPGRKSGEALLNVGGHQVRLHSGMPTMKEGLNQMRAEDLDSNPIIPGCSLLIRLLPKTEELVPAPKYSTGYYRSGACKPTASESRIYASYAADNVAHPKTEREMIVQLRQLEKSGSKGSDSQLTSWLLNKLDIKKQQGTTQPATNLSLHRCLRYRVKVGLKVQIKAAFGLPDGLYIQCLAYVAPGKQAKYMSTTEEGYGKKEQFITTKLSATSHLTAPVWDSQPKEMHPYYDDNTCLIIQLVALKVLYRPRADHKSAGSVHQPDGRPLEISRDEMIGWTVVPLFDGNSVVSGTHTVPVLTLPLDEEIIDNLSQSSAQKVLASNIWNNFTRMAGASVQVMVWDAHFDVNELPEKRDRQDLLETVGGVEQCLNMIRTADPGGQTQQEFLMEVLDEKTRKQGLTGATFKNEMKFFTETMATCFTDLMNEYCKQHGLGPL